MTNGPHLESFLVACNHANRSGTAQDLNQTMKAYFLAVTSACTFAYGLGKAVARAPPHLQKYSVIVPCLATAAANISNVGFTRSDEITVGAPVTDGDGQVCLISICAYVLIVI